VQPPDLRVGVPASDESRSPRPGRGPVASVGKPRSRAVSARRVSAAFDRAGACTVAILTD
jgi:hypothetical protein